jgi:hypothetical protein
MSSQITYNGSGAAAHQAAPARRKPLNITIRKVRHAMTATSEHLARNIPLTPSATPARSRPPVPEHSCQAGRTG